MLTRFERSGAERENELKKETYYKMLGYVRERKWLLGFVTKGGRLLSLVSYVFYPVLLVCVFAAGHPDAWKAAAVPGAGFVLLSIVRAEINAPRPYETFEAVPVIEKDTKGKSFPSRHVFSAFIIAFTAAWYYPGAGFVLAVCGTALAATRVLGGVHFIRDVAAGAAAGIGLGMAGFMLL